MIDRAEIHETILVVEDDVLIRMPIAQYLRDCGYKVIEAVNADEAMTVLLHRDKIIDIVFSDIEMPGSVDGFGLSKWIRENRPGMDVDSRRHLAAHRRCGARLVRAQPDAEAL